MKKIFMLVALFAAATLGAHAQLLYKISGKDLKSPSYVLGTYHVAPHTFVDSIPGLKNVYGEVKQVYGEVVTSEMTSQENMMKLMKMMMLPEGQTLFTIYNADEMKEIDAVIQKIMGVSIENPMVKNQLSKLTPQTLSTQLTALIAMKMNPGIDMTKTLDIQLQNMAVEKGLKVGGLESIDSQLKILYDVPMEKGKKALLCFVRNVDAAAAQGEHLHKAYMKRDIKDVESAMNERLNNECDPSEEDLNTLLYNRNNAWIEIMPGIMDAPTLFAVGAGHLIGERGILSLLKKAGYNVEAVDVVKNNCCK